MVITYFYSDVDSLLDRGDVPFPDETGIPEAVRMTKAAGTAVTPNLSFVAMTRRQLDDIEAVLADCWPVPREIGSRRTARTGGGWSYAL